MHYFIAKNFLASMNTTGKITNVISVVGISLGSFALIISISVLNGFENKLDEKISNFDGHLRIPNSISNDELSKIKSLKEVKSVIFNYERKGMINYLSNQSLVTFKQVSADYFESFNEIPYVGALPLENEILLGNDIASRLGIRIGDIVKISSPLDKKFLLGFPPTLEVKVSGIFSSKILNYDNKYIFISKTIGKTLFSNVIKDQFIDLKLHHSSKIDQTIIECSNIIGSKTISSWRDRNVALVGAIQMEKIGSVVVLSLILLVASFSILSTIYLITIRKIKDLGILRFLGMKMDDIHHLILYQAIIIGFRGVCIGFVSGISVVLFQNILKIISLPNDIYAMEVLPMFLAPKDIIIILSINIFFILSTGFYGARKFLKYDPLEMLRWVK